eukprot:2662990-Prymnesium_polylepis.2
MRTPRCLALGVRLARLFKPPKATHRYNQFTGEDTGPHPRMGMPQPKQATAARSQRVGRCVSNSYKIRHVLV